MISIKKMFIPFCWLIQSLYCDMPITSSDTKPHITIFVHGIMSVTPYLSFRNLPLFFKDQVLNTVYSKGVELTRRKQYFWWGQAIQNFGLHQIDLTTIEKTKAASTIALLYDMVFVNNFGNTTKRFYYTFGWSGLLSHKQRYYDAHEFFIALEQLVSEYKRKNQDPFITIIGYSHGGNVALDLAAVYERFYPDSTLTIDELILLGAPLITETDHLVQSNIFKKVYNIISPLDRIQTMDLFSFNRFFSKKLFKNRRNFTIPEKLTQIIVKIRKPIKTKKSKATKEKRALLRQNINNPAIISGHSRLLSHVSAGHIELWFFGWTPQHYSKGFVFNPLPLVVLLPYIIQCVSKHKNIFDSSHPIITDMRPHDNFMILKQHNKNLIYATEPFIDKKIMSEMKAIALKVKPDNYTNYDFKRYLKEAYQQAELLQQQSELFTKKIFRKNQKRSRMRMSSIKR